MSLEGDLDTWSSESVMWGTAGGLLVTGILGNPGQVSLPLWALSPPLENEAQESSQRGTTLQFGCSEVAT